MIQSPYAKLFTALQQKIKEEVPEIQWIDFDLGQVDKYVTTPPVLFPCVLIEFADTAFQQMQHGQWGTMTILLKLAFARYDTSNAETPEYVLEQAMDFLEIEHKLYNALKYTTLDGVLIKELRRLKVTSDLNRQDDLRVRKMQWSATFEDND